MVQNAKSTQEFVPIKEIKDDVVIMKDNSIRAVLMTSSLNFSLKSEDMQNAIILQFQNFINSLDFSIQIFIQSRRLDMRPYIISLEEIRAKQTMDLMKIQVSEYIKFIEDFSSSVNVMSKGFFVVVSFSFGAINTKKGIGGISNPFGKKKNVEESENMNFEEMRVQLDQRISVVEQGLVRCGIRTARLGTEELVELYYRLFNPSETEKAIKIE